LSTHLRLGHPSGHFPSGFPTNILLGVGWDWVHLVRRPLIALLYQPRMIDNDECRAVGGMMIGRGNRSTRRKPAQSPLRPPQIPRDLTWDRNLSTFIITLLSLYLNNRIWEELIACFPLLRQGPYRKRCLQQFFAAGTCLPSRWLAAIEGYTGRPTDPPLLRHAPYRKRHVRQLLCCSFYSLLRERVYRAVA
jgi:hypothetical protein